MANSDTGSPRVRPLDYDSINLTRDRIIFTNNVKLTYEEMCPSDDGPVGYMEM